MSRDTAKAFYNKQAGDPATGYVSPSDAQSAIDVIYDDMSASSSGGSSTALASPLRGKSAVNEKKWRDALLRAQQGGKARILCLGTSNTYGWGPSTPATMNWPKLLSEKLESVLGIPSVFGPEPLTKFSVDGLDAGVVHERPWFTNGTWSYSYDTYYADSGAATGDPGQTVGPKFSKTVREALSIMYFDRTAGRTIPYRIGASTGTITTTGTNKLMELVIPASGSVTLELLEPTGGTAIVQALGETVNKGIDVLNWGIPGLVLSKLVKDPGQWWSTLSLFDGIKPDMVIIEAGANDTGGITPPATVGSQLDTLVAAIQANSQAAVMLCETYSANDSAYVEAIRDVADARGAYSLSLMTIMQGNRDPWRASVNDASHMSQDGYEVWASGIASALLGNVPRLLF